MNPSIGSEMTRKVCEKDMMRQTILFVLIGAIIVWDTHGEPARVDHTKLESSKAPWNQTILRQVKSMPSGGGYAAGKTALNKLADAVKSIPSGLKVDTKIANPSFCSGATYLVFAAVLNELVVNRRVREESAALARIAIHRQPDGVGVWGRWNANGPGVARLFHETGMGINFESIENALPGDFMKIFWTDEVGCNEFGHLVVFMGCKTGADGVKFVSFWSSNKPDGYGEKEVPLEKVKWAIFSRLLHPERVVVMPSIDSMDRDLSNMLKLSFSKDHVRRLVGITLDPTQRVMVPNLSRIVTDSPKGLPASKQSSGELHELKTERIQPANK
jgi:hypothetical protein